MKHPKSEVLKFTQNIFWFFECEALNSFPHWNCHCFKRWFIGKVITKRRHRDLPSTDWPQITMMVGVVPDCSQELGICFRAPIMGTEAQAFGPSSVAFSVASKWNWIRSGAVKTWTGAQIAVDYSHIACCGFTCYATAPVLSKHMRHVPPAWAFPGSHRLWPITGSQFYIHSEDKTLVLMIIWRSLP